MAEEENFDPVYIYWSMGDSLGFTGQEIPEGATEISFDTYTSLVAQQQADIQAAKDALAEELESS